MDEFLIVVLIIVVLLFSFDYENNQDYYTQCTNGGHSYARCFYDHVLKP